MTRVSFPVTAITNILVVASICVPYFILLATLPANPDCLTSDYIVSATAGGVTLGSAIGSLLGIGAQAANFVGLIGRVGRLFAAVDKTGGDRAGWEEGGHLPQAANEELVDVDDIAIASLAEEAKDIVASVTFSVRPGGSLCIVGPSGVGKSTILRAIGGLWPTAKGTIRVPETDVMFLSQNPYVVIGGLM